MVLGAKFYLPHARGAPAGLQQPLLPVGVAGTWFCFHVACGSCFRGHVAKGCSGAGSPVTHCSYLLPAALTPSGGSDDAVSLVGWQLD